MKQRLLLVLSAALRHVLARPMAAHEEYIRCLEATMAAASTSSVTPVCTVLTLDHASLSGRIPREVGMLVGLSSLDVSYNELTGPLPTEVALLTALRRLTVSGNNLMGTIPDCIFRSPAAPNMDSVSLFDNSFTGAIPTEVGMLTSLKQFWSFGNALNCVLPTEVALLSPTLFDTDVCHTEVVSS